MTASGATTYVDGLKAHLYRLHLQPEFLEFVPSFYDSLQAPGQSKAASVLINTKTRGRDDIGDAQGSDVGSALVRDSHVDGMLQAGFVSDTALALLAVVARHSCKFNGRPVAQVSVAIRLGLLVPLQTQKLFPSRMHRCTRSCLV